MHKYIVLGIDPGYALIGFSVLSYNKYNSLNRRGLNKKGDNNKIFNKGFVDTNIIGRNIIRKNTIDENIGIELISYGVITTSSKDLYFDRLKEIADNVEVLLKRYKPDILAIERVYYFKNKKTIMNVSEIRGAIILLALQNNIPVYEFTPLQIKLAITSYGKATKLQVQKMIKRLFNLDKIPEPDDAADAIACGLTYIWSQKNVLGN